MVALAGCFIFGEILWHYCLKLSFVYKTISQICFNLLCCSGDKRLLSEFLNK